MRGRHQRVRGHERGVLSFHHMSSEKRAQVFRLDSKGLSSWAILPVLWRTQFRGFLHPSPGMAEVTLVTSLLLFKIHMQKNQSVFYVDQLFLVQKLAPVCGQYTHWHSMEENWFSISQQLSNIATFLMRSGSLHPLPLLIAIFAWFECVQVLLVLEQSLSSFVCHSCGI